MVQYCLGGLDEQFGKLNCIMDHMIEYKDQQKYIFSNYIVMFSHVFKGLQYLHDNNIIHGDVKGYDFISYYLATYTFCAILKCDGLKYL